MKNPFDYHKPGDAQVAVIEGIRAAYKACHAHLLNLPPCRERSVAITELETSGMWAVKGIVMQDADGS